MKPKNAKQIPFVVVFFLYFSRSLNIVTRATMAKQHYSTTPKSHSSASRSHFSMLHLEFEWEYKFANKKRSERIAPCIQLFGPGASLLASLWTIIIVPNHHYRQLENPYTQHTIETVCFLSFCLAWWAVVNFSTLLFLSIRLITFRLIWQHKCDEREKETRRNCILVIVFRHEGHEMHLLLNFLLSAQIADPRTQKPEKLFWTFLEFGARASVHIKIALWVNACEARQWHPTTTNALDDSGNGCSHLRFSESIWWEWRAAKNAWFRWSAKPIASGIDGIRRNVESAHALRNWLSKNIVVLKCSISIFRYSSHRRTCIVL